MWIKLEIENLDVAGAGFAPAPQGYEPCELLLLNPAVFFIISF